MRCPAAPRAQSLLKIFSVGVGPIRANRILRRPEFEPAGAHQARKLPFEPVLALGIPFRLDRAARLRPKIAVIVRAAKIERDQMVDLKVGVRAGREPVFRENAIVAGSRPMPELPRVAIAADVRRAGRADRAGVRAGSGSAPRAAAEGGHHDGEARERGRPGLPPGIGAYLRSQSGDGRLESSMGNHGDRQPRDRARSRRKTQHSARSL
jgi:hypothetical protein